MKTKIISSFLILAVSVGTMFAWDYEHVQIADLYYNLDATNQTAEVTSQISDYPYWSTTITTANIPSSVEYNSVAYSVTSIGNKAFRGCTGLTSVTIPNSVTSIGNSAFSGCSGLTSVTIGNSVTSIGNKAFRGCTGLTSVTIPNSVTSIGDYAFRDCSSLTSITIPNSVTSIGSSAFSDCKGLISVTIGNGVTSIGERAFAYCSGLTSVTIPNSVTSIGESAFRGCTGLTSVTIPGSVTSIGDGAFARCTGLTSINVASDNSNYCSVDGVLFNKDKTTLIQYPGGKQGAYTIPNNVTSIGEEAFCECSGLTSVTIPNNVTSIGGWAFYKCTGLTSVTIGNGVTSIGVVAFAGCSGLTSVTIPNSVTSIGESAFRGCTGLTSVTIPGSVTSIGNGAFSFCTALISIDVASDNSNYCSVDGVLFNKDETTLIQYPGGKQGAYTIPNSVTSIGSSAFEGCSGLTSVTIPNSVRIIGDYAFKGCSGLTSVTIPNSVTRIGESAFYYCSGLTSVTIGNSVTYIGESAFYGCSGLTSVTCFATTPPHLDDVVFSGVFTYTPCVLYVPAGSISAYKSANQWKDFSNILPIGAQPADVTTTTVTPSETTADIAWPQVTGAATYTIEIKKNGELICTLTFNAQGQLISIAFNAPSRNNAPQQAQAAGFSFTVTSLDSGTTYSYTMTAKDNNGNVLKTESGTFTTNGEPQGIEDVQSVQAQSTRILLNGQIYILRGEKVYSITGQEVR